jgi:hypothetical protein
MSDTNRRTRQGRRTLDRVLQGIGLRHEHGISFEVIRVLTADALDYPDELFDFYQEFGIGSVGFNVEEIEGPHTASSLQRAGTPQRFRRFLTRFLALTRSADPPLLVREFETSAAALLGARRSGPGTRTQENKPWAIVNVDLRLVHDPGRRIPGLQGPASPPGGSLRGGRQQPRWATASRGVALFAGPLDALALLGGRRAAAVGRNQPG